MTTIKQFLLLAAVGSSVIVASCSKSDNKQTVYSGTGAMTTAQETPAVTNSSASGTYTASYDKGTKTLTYNIAWTGLADTITQSHIHGTAPKGTAAPVKVGFNIANKGALTGTYSGTATVDENLIKEDSLLKGFYYLNVHTKKNPGGEIRGQIEIK